MRNFSVRPLYLQVRDALAERIASGEWKPNTAIPNKTDLARESGVSPGTIRKALDLLEADGLITRRQGRGTFINDPASSELAARYNNLHAAGSKPVIGEIKVLSSAEDLASDTERARLHLGEHEQVCRIRRSWAHAAGTYLAEETSLPSALFPRLAETNLRSHSIVAIAHAYGVLLGDAVERVTVGSASPAAAEALKVTRGSPVLVLDRIIATRDGRPAEWRRAECKMSKMYYQVEIS